MKKTIAMTLVALCSMAVGATPDGTREEIWKLDFTGSSTTVTHKDGVTLNVGDNPWPSDSGNAYTDAGLQMHNHKYAFQQTAGQLSFADEFALVLTLTYDSHNGSWPVLFCLGENGSYNWKAAYYVSDNHFVLDKDGYGATETYKASGNISATAGNTYTLTLYNSGKYKGEESGMLTLYVDGQEAGHSKFNNTTNYDGTGDIVSNFALGGKINSGNTSNITVSSAALYKYVPEPTTATLSLLALAGLAARRRRR